MTLTFGFDPIIAQLGPSQLGWHGVFTALAVVAALRVALWLGERRGFSQAALADVAIWGVVGGIVGARAFHVLDHLSSYLEHPLAIVAIWEGGIAVYGAFLGGIAGGWLAARRAHLPVWRLLDVAAPAMLLGQAVGRLGCLSNGDGWGAPCTSGFCPLCIVYTNAHDLLPKDLKGVPTQAYPAYEIAAELLLLLALWAARRRLPAPGQQFLVAAVGYGVIRFGLTFLREEVVLAWGLQEAQLIALGTLALALALLLARARGGLRLVWRGAVG